MSNMPRKTINPGTDRRGAAKGSQNGQVPFVPTEKQREFVELQSAYGTPQEKIASNAIFRTAKFPDGISMITLTRHFRKEIDEGIEAANATLGGVLFLEAKKGNVRALEQWFDRRGGAKWKRKVAQEHSGPDGGPIRYSDLTDEEIDAKLQALTTGSDVDSISEPGPQSED